jgi:hypothetical protein
MAAPPSFRYLLWVVFDMRKPAGATWSTRILRLLPDAVRGHEQDVGGRKNPHPLTPESSSGNRDLPKRPTQSYPELPEPT